MKKKTRPRRRGPRARPRRTLGIGVALGAGILLLPPLALFGWASLPGPGSGKRILFDWPEGVDAAGAGARLERAGLLTSPRLFAWYLRLVGGASELEPGPHLLNDSLSARSLAARLTRSRLRATKKLTLPEGWSQFEIARRLEEHEICSEATFRKATRDPALRRELGVQGESVEGLLFPATYELAVDSRPEDVIRLLVKTFRKRFDALSAKHPGSVEGLRQKRGWGEHEIATLASIVEREARIEDERPLIASVYLNRLDDPEHKPERMLQADPTAAYGCLIEPTLPSCAGYDGRVTPTMLRDGQNRYNTYKHAGLPPGPIANPGEASLRAVLAPASTDYLFFVTTGGGKHRFSRSFADHEKAIRETAP